ncbi:hypothetical protein JCGZ_17401 [Jatropha curcas]|uniref:peptidylprolyl isomerase n=1 Tax=Jatropha curcas TaxID=180498 RepID=A0A067LMZ4_JATCU|nr:hypothetical protein JCGZ_17401 [Jatropha curcas]
MAFWGTEVKPGKPFTQSPDNDGRGRLHISQATLGSGKVGSKSVTVQCNVGNRSPVFLCSLFPQRQESCQLNLEFDEPQEVVFSVIGPRSVHLTATSESFGEDIANTETERSDDVSDEDEDEYEDSFIDDGDTEFTTHSPVSSDGVFEEMSHRRKPKNEKFGRRRLRKKYQQGQSDEECPYQQNAIVNGGTCMPRLDEDEEEILLSPFYRSSARCISEAEENAKKETGETINKEVEDEAERKADAVVDSELKSQPDQHGSIVSSAQIGLENGGVKPKKKKKKQIKEEEQVKAGIEDDFFSGTGLKWDKAKPSETTANKSNQDTTVICEDKKRTENYNQPDQHESLLPSAQVSSEDGVKPKKKRKKQSKVEEQVKAESEDYFFGTVLKREVKQSETNAGQPNQESETKADQSNQGITVIDEDNNRTESDNQPDQHEPLLTSAQLGSENGIKPKKKRKKQSKVEEQFKAESEYDSSFGTVLKWDKAKQTETIADRLNQDRTVIDEDNKTTGSDNRPDQHEFVLSSAQLGSENGIKPKKKKKKQKQTKEEQKVKARSEDEVYFGTGLKWDKAKQSETKADQSNQDMTAMDEDSKRAENDKVVDNIADQSANANHSQKKKKKKKIRTQENGEALDMEGSKERSFMEVEDNDADENSSWLGTYGLVMEKLETGKQNGKIAGPGEKAKEVS